MHEMSKWLSGPPMQNSVSKAGSIFVPGSCCVVVAAAAVQNFVEIFGEEQMAGLGLTYVLSGFKCEPSPSWEKMEKKIETSWKNFQGVFDLDSDEFNSFQTGHAPDVGKEVAWFILSIQLSRVLI